MNNAHLHRCNFLLHLQERAGYDQPVLLKEPVHEQPARLHLDQLHNEYAITTQLADVAGVRLAYALEGTESQPVLLLEYIPGQSLTELIRAVSLNMAEKLRLAVNIATILSRIHDQQVMHKDISSGNILVADNHKPGSQDGVYIIDFGIASTMQQESVSRLASGDALVGTLAYISPEQTGRMNRQVDYRTDLYSLGVVLYELFTGQLPFESGDALEMIHAHIARQPQPPHQIDAGISGPVSDIILKLLAKNAEDRYQTALGLQIDLQRCLEQWQNNNRIEPFALGSDDFTGRLQIPRKLYGRQAEIEQLHAVLDRAISGSPQLLLVAGYSGVGKTALVHEIQTDVIAKQAVFVEGKVDQLQRTLPYFAWAQAFTRLVHNWLAERETNLAGWRETILDAVGDQGRILIDIIPALERIIGPQPEVPQLGGVEAQNRFNYVFNRFISSLATPEHPLVVFLDDLQWIDPASLNLIEALFAGQITSSFLVIGAYRDNEVGDDHPLMASQERMRAEGDRVTVIALGDLAPKDTNRLLADSLHLTVADCRDLSQVLVEKTAGNPFYFRQLLYALESERLLRFNRQRRRWVWEEELQKSLQAGGNVVELMIGKIQTLPVETQRILSMAACLGSQFGIATLGTSTGQPQSDILTALNPALQGQLIVQSNGNFVFSHDRIQEAGYALIPESERPTTHLEIGRLLLAGTTSDLLEEEIFDIVRHLNTGRALIDTDSEKIELAVLNLKAGQKAKATAAYSDAKKYIEIGIELLGPNSWQEQYELTLSLYNENGELAALTGQFDHVSTSADLIHANAIRILDRVRIYMAQIEAETVQYNFAKGLEIGLEALKDLGVDIPAQPGAEDYQRLKDRLVASLARRSEESWVELPEMSDETALAASSLLASEMSTTYVGNPSLYPIIAYEGAILTLEFGLDAWSPFFFACVAMVALSLVDLETPADVALDQILFAKRLQKIAREMLKNPVTARSKARGLLMLAFVSAWTEPIEKGIELSQAAYLGGYQTGDALYSAYGAVQFAKQAFTAGTNLVDYQNQLSDCADSLSRIGQILAPQWLAMNLQTAQNFRETLPDPDELRGAYFDEDEWLPAALASNDMSGRHNHSVCKLLLAYHFDVDDRLDKYARKAEELIGGGKGNITTALFYLYFALSKLRLARENGTKYDPGTMNLVNSYLQLVELWSQSAPTTFQHMYDLIMAEKARGLGDVDAAISHYEQAISSARENGFTHEEALANELYARFWYDRANDRFASTLMREAHSLYRRWGAFGKAEHLKNRYPRLLVDRAVVVGGPRSGTSIDPMTGDLDLLTILKASQAIAGEIELDRLLGRLITIAVENAGAERGFLILEQKGAWFIEAAADIGEAKPRVRQAIPIAESNLLSEGVVQYVARTQQTVVLGDAAREGGFRQDAYIQDRQVKSLLCTPLFNQGKTSAVLYLENNLAADVFTPDRVALLEMLTGQMAAAIDNAWLHSQLGDLLVARTRALDSAEAQIRSLFENTNLGIALTTFQGQVIAANQALLDMTGYTEAEMQQHNIATLYRNPDQRTSLLQELGSKRSVQNFGVQARRKDGTHFLASLNVSLVAHQDEREVLLTIVEDVTEKFKAEAALRESEQKFRTVAEQSPNMIIINQKGRVVFANQKCEETTGYSQEELISPEFDFMTLIAPDSKDLVKTSLARHMRGEEVQPYEYTLLTAAGEILEVINTSKLIDYQGERAVLGIVTDITHQKEVEDALQRANHELAELLASSRRMTATLDLDALLNVILDHLGNMVQSDNISIWMREGDSLVIRASRSAEGAGSLVGTRFSLAAIPMAREVMTTREAVIIDDVREDRELAQSIETAFGRPIGGYLPAATGFLAVPLVAKERVFGIISLAHSQPGYYTREMVDLVQAFANQAAIAIENARLHRQVQQTATLEERARLARELHDSVTQALFTMTLFAQAGRTGIEAGDLDGAAHYLTRILETGHQASKEMRLFIYELLPEPLVHLGLVDAIQERLNAVEKRAGLKISFTAGELGDLPGPVNEVLYRISQEALNNSLKHARADVVTVTIHRQGQRLCLEIIDDGQGFDPLEAGGRGGLGLISMRERAEQLGGEFNIDSAPQGGTKISVVLEVSG